MVIQCLQNTSLVFMFLNHPLPPGNSSNTKTYNQVFPAHTQEPIYS